MDRRTHTNRFRRTSPEVSTLWPHSPPFVVLLGHFSAVCLHLVEDLPMAASGLDYGSVSVPARSGTAEDIVPLHHAEYVAGAFPTLSY